MSFENSALLVKLQIGKWTGKKDDKKSEREIASTHNVQGVFGDVRKDLISRVAFRSITECESAIRAHHSKFTQPWAPGVAILPSAVYFEYVRGLSSLKEAFYSAANAFVSQYPVLKSDSKLRLGDKYDDNDYPDRDVLTKKFYVQTDFIPLASASGITLDLAQEELDKLGDSYTRTLADMERSSQSASWEALTSAIDNLVERLKDPSTARLGQMERIKTIAELTKKMNVTKSVGLNSVCDDILATVCICTMEDIKDDVVIHQAVMDAAKEVRKKIGLIAPQKG